MELELTSKNVEDSFMSCLFKKDEDTKQAVIVEGITAKFGFHPARLEEQRANVRAMLSQLPDAFQIQLGGGWSFLAMCARKDGEQWGEHINVEQLLVLSIALNFARILMPREFWSTLPGGMPYIGLNLADKIPATLPEKI